MAHDQDRNNKVENLNSDELTYTLAALLGRNKDGDSLVATYVDQGHGHRWHDKDIRLGGINTPEVRGDVEREAGKLVSAYLFMFLVKHDYLKEDEEDRTHRRIWFKTWDKEDNFGRLLGELVTHDKVSINQMLLDKGMAKPFKKGEHFNQEECEEVIAKAEKCILELQGEGDAKPK